MMIGRVDFSFNIFVIILYSIGSLAQEIMNKKMICL